MVKHHGLLERKTMPGLDTWSPLFSSIVQSSIWGKPPHIKIVWITMLALKDKTGFVESSVSGLARASVVTMEQCQEALDDFLSPDGDSKCKDNEGMKIKVGNGGWYILGHERFQTKMKDVSTKINNAKRQAKFRAKKKGDPLPGESSYVLLSKNGLDKAAQEALDHQPSKTNSFKEEPVTLISSVSIETQSGTEMI